MHILPTPLLIRRGCARVNRLNSYQPGAEKQRVWRERLVGVLPGRKGSRMRCYPLKLTNSTGIMCRTKDVNSVKSLECFKELCVCAVSPLPGLARLRWQGWDSCGCDKCDKGLLNNVLNSNQWELLPHEAPGEGK